MILASLQRSKSCYPKKTIYLCLSRCRAGLEATLDCTRWDALLRLKAPVPPQGRVFHLCSPPPFAGEIQEQGPQEISVYLPKSGPRLPMLGENQILCLFRKSF